MRRNETKILVLNVLNEFGSGRLRSIQEWIENEGVNLSDGSIKMCLSRCFKWHLVKRRNGVYSISELGQERLVWLRQQKAQKELEETGFIGSMY